MELGVTKTNIQAIREPGGMEFLTGGAHVRPIGGGPLHPLGDPDLGGGEVTVEHRARCHGLRLPKAADVALLGWHAAKEDSLVLQLERIKYSEQKIWYSTRVVFVHLFLVQIYILNQ